MTQSRERPTPTGAIAVPLAPGELIDKITILEIKSARIGEPAKQANVRHELALLEAARDQAVPASAELISLTRELKAVNETLWRIEDDIRACEAEQDFAAGFVALARAVYRNNDTRATIKRRINQLLGSAILEEKSYRPY
jgi:post-segregation antitoxin (ccd killing protein)